MNETRGAGERRGRLRLYTGPVPGVGKTSRMLEDAARLRSRGVDVALAFVEGHGRRNVEARAEGFPRIASRPLQHHGVAGVEMDLDAVLVRRPAVVIVDDIAHVNAPGSRNSRRYQDADALLASGVDVLATLGTYHLDSLNDVVEQLTGLSVRETVPDSVLRRADSVVHVDADGETLAERLNAGDIFPADQLAWARGHWFRPAAFDALRELSFRQLAEALAARPDGARPAAERLNERVMVCLSSFSPRALALLRRGSRIAGRLNTHWFVVYVETPHEVPSRMPDAVRRHLAASVEKARELGAEVVFLKAHDPVPALVDFARARGVAHVVIGHSPSRFWTEILGRSMVTRLARAASAFDLYVLATEDPA